MYCSQKLKCTVKQKKLCFIEVQTFISSVSLVSKLWTYRIACHFICIAYSTSEKTVHACSLKLYC
jgi:hypothetical protein